MNRKRPPTFSVDGLVRDMGFSDFAAGIVCVSRLFPLQSGQGIDAQASQGVQPLVRNEVTQNSPDFNRPGCLLRRTHILPSGEYRSAPLLPRDYLMEICSPSTIMRSLSTFSAASIASLMALPTRVTPHCAAKERYSPLLSAVTFCFRISNIPAANSSGAICLMSRSTSPGSELYLFSVIQIQEPISSDNAVTLAAVHLLLIGSLHDARDLFTVEIPHNAF